MRLINTSTLKMEEFISGANCVYAVLSHTWGEEEVSFQQYSTPEARLMAGYRKIERSCALASRSWLPYLWIDTCCIDKSSSAELSEAINSMYRWYRDAAVCYVHLSDMKRCEENGSIFSTNFQMLQACRWFTRGWTLQELLAPQNVKFYDQDWVLIGTKTTMWRLLGRITGIKPEHLWKSQEASVAQKMSWAAKRQTTRTEDLAYSLLGLFNVNMPLLYGEGEKAFKRLQHEILHWTNDESIFAWTDDRVWTSGLLAESPANFAESGGVEPIHQFYRKPYTITNQGLQIELRHSNSENEEAGTFETPLLCTDSPSEHVISLHMTYYTDKFGALRALRTGPFTGSIMRNELLRSMNKSSSFHIDDFRRPKLPPHSNFVLKGSCLDSLTLRLSGESRREDIWIFKETGIENKKGFSIVDRSRGVLAGRSIKKFPMMYVSWSHGPDPTHLTLNIRPFDPSGFDSTQELFSADKHPLNDFKLQAGNSLATWFGGGKILFIALSRHLPAKHCIDLQLDSIRSGTEGLLQLTKADPLRSHKDYPKIELVPAFSQFKLPSVEGSGQMIYGQELSALPYISEID